MRIYTPPPLFVIASFFLTEFQIKLYNVKNLPRR
jgi:hypothetical protein